MFSCIQKLYQADDFSNVLESIGYVHQYQPIVSAADCRILGYESLIRKPIAGHTDRAQAILKSAKDNESSEYFDYFAFRSCCEGVQFAIDNYGESWSCLELVRSAPIKWLKLSRQSILDLETFPRGQLFRVHKAVVNVCVNRDIGVICQGIETARHEAIARQIGATLLQGFRYGKPDTTLLKSGNFTQPKVLIS